MASCNVKNTYLDYVNIDKNLDIHIEKLSLKCDNYKNEDVGDSHRKKSPTVLVQDCIENVVETIENQDTTTNLASSEEDNLSDFLVETADQKLKSLRTKCSLLEKSLSEAHKQIKVLNQEICEAKKREHLLNKNLTASEKHLISVENSLKRREKICKEHTENFSRKAQECQELHRRVNNIEKELKKEEKKAASLQTQNHKLQSKFAACQTKVSDEHRKLKEEKEILRIKIKDTEEKNKALGKLITSLELLVKKQEQMINVLQLQKLNIISGKVGKNLEEEFRSLVETLMEPKDKNAADDSQT